MARVAVRLRRTWRAGPLHARHRYLDHVVLACHADEALGLLDDAAMWNRAVLGAITYQQNDTVLPHRCAPVAAQRRAWPPGMRMYRPRRRAVHGELCMNLLQSVQSRNRSWSR